MDEPDQHRLGDSAPTLTELVFACVMLAIAGYAFYSAAVIVLRAL